MHVMTKLKRCRSLTCVYVSMFISLCSNRYISTITIRLYACYATRCMTDDERRTNPVLSCAPVAAVDGGCGLAGHDLLPPNRRPSVPPILLDLVKQGGQAGKSTTPISCKHLHLRLRLCHIPCYAVWFGVLSSIISPNHTSYHIYIYIRSS
jgi:hypothetical protein